MDEQKLREVSICLEGIDEGRAIELVNERLTAIAEDCAARPNVVGWREVTVKIKIKPVQDPQYPEINTPEIQVSTAAKFPSLVRKSSALVRSGRVFVNAPFSDPRQNVINFDDQKQVK